MMKNIELSAEQKGLTMILTRKNGTSPLGYTIPTRRQREKDQKGAVTFIKLLSLKAKTESRESGEIVGCRELL